MSFVTELLVKTFIDTLCFAGLIVASGLILHILRTYSIKNFQRSFGKNAIMFTGFIGVPVHELSHAVFALLFGHKLTGIKLFQSPDENGIMGYVNHSYNGNSIYQQAGNFFIGIAPILGGTITIIILMHFALPDTYNLFIKLLIKESKVVAINKSDIEGLLKAYGTLTGTVFSLKHLANPFFYLFIFAAISIASHISLSPADIKGASNGLVSIMLVIFLLNILNASKFLPMVEIIRYNMFLSGVLILTVFLSFTTYMASLISLLVKRVIFSI